VAFIWAPEEEGQFQPGRCNRWWLHNSLKSLAAAVKKLGSRLILRAAKQARPTGGAPRWEQPAGPNPRSSGKKHHPAGGSRAKRLPDPACGVA